MKHLKWVVAFSTVIFSLLRAENAPEPVPSSTLSTTVETKPFSPTYQFNALLQAWTVSDVANTKSNALNFRLRRAELKLSGKIVPAMRYFVMVDPAKTINSTGDGKILQDLGVGISPFAHFEIIAGQFKTQTSAEGLSPTAELLIPERSFTSRNFGDRREPGLMVAYAVPEFRIATMISNGSGTNTDSNRATKDLTTRADIFFSKQLTAGAYFQLGNLEYSDKASWGVNSRVSPLRDFSLSVEYDRGRFAGVNQWGLAVEAAYVIDENIQAVLRQEWIRPNTLKSELAQQFTAGVDYLLMNHNAKLQVAVGSLTNMTANNGSPRLEIGSNGPTGTLAFQAAL